MSLFLTTLKLLLLAVFGSQPLSIDKGMATRYGDPGDKLAGAHLSCTHKKMEPGQLVCAHRTLPCGTPLVVENVRNGKLAFCEVLDRGPYGANGPHGWKIKRRASESGTWRGMIDLSPTVARALTFNGREPVRIFFPTNATELGKLQRQKARERRQAEAAEKERRRQRKHAEPLLSSL